MFGSCSSFNDSDEEEDSLPTSSPRPTRPTHCNKNDSNQHCSQSPRCIFQRSPFLSLQSTNDDELMSRLSTLPMLDSISSTHKIGMKQEASTSSSKIPSPSPPRRRILPIPPQYPQLLTTTTTIPTTEDIKIPQSSSSKRPSGSCLRRSRFSFPSELSEIAARNVDCRLCTIR